MAMSLEQIDRASQLAHMSRALWVALTAENIGEMRSSDVGWLTSLGSELADELVSITRAAALTPPAKDGA